MDTDARGYFQVERRCVPLWAGSQSFVSPSLARTCGEYGSVRCEGRGWRAQRWAWTGEGVRGGEDEEGERARDARANWTYGMGHEPQTPWSELLRCSCQSHNCNRGHAVNPQQSPSQSPVSPLRIPQNNIIVTCKPYRPLSSLPTAAPAPTPAPTPAPPPAHSPAAARRPVVPRPNPPRPPVPVPTSGLPTLSSDRMLKVARRLSRIKSSPRPAHPARSSGRSHQPSSVPRSKLALLPRDLVC